MLPNGIAGVEFHHEHRVLYKSLPKHHDHIYKCISSDDRLNRIAGTGVPVFFLLGALELLVHTLDNGVKILIAHTKSKKSSLKGFK
jgi:hypothetical protein